MSNVVQSDFDTDMGGERTLWSRALSAVQASVGKLILLVIALSLGGLMAEGIVRLVAPQQLIIKRPDIWMGSDSLGWTHRPGVDATINTGERTVRVRTDSLGRRVGTSRRTDGDQRILLLGDSYTEAFQVEYDDSFAGILERELSRHLGVEVASENSGVGGWGPPQYLREVRASLQRRSYDLVGVFLYIGNDVVTRRPDSISRRTPTETHEFQLPDNLTYQEIIDAWLYPVNDFLEVRSQAFVLFKRGARGILRRLNLTAGYFPEVFLEGTLDSDRWAVTADICEDIADLAANHGVPVSFVIIPTSYQVEEAKYWDAVDAFGLERDSVVEKLGIPNRRLAAELRERDLSVIDVLPRFREARQSDEKLYGTVDAHLSPAGHRILGHYLVPKFADLMTGIDRR